jgi:hypothetical protein
MGDASADDRDDRHETGDHDQCERFNRGHRVMGQSAADDEQDQTDDGELESNARRRANAMATRRRMAVDWGSRATLGGCGTTTANAEWNGIRSPQ